MRQCELVEGRRPIEARAHHELRTLKCWDLAVGNIAEGHATGSHFRLEIRPARVDANLRWLEYLAEAGNLLADFEVVPG